ncbi:MAG: LamG-like jellyroll fold domain-containing protein [Verrucomicrobiota bacterium]
MIQTVTVNVSSGAQSVNRLYAQIHNLRFGGQVSVKVNNGEWITLYNHTISILEPEHSQGGIGGINSTIRFDASLPAGLVVTGNNDVSFRLNGTNGVVSTIRVLDFDFIDTSENRILGTQYFTQEDPNGWTAPRPGEEAQGQTLWSTANLVNDPVTLQSINASCSSCHFEDGSDLTYFNYSNESIITRAMFHGLTQTEAEQVTSYIRSHTSPNPGRPWNPPFQPGPNLDPQPSDSTAVVLDKTQKWMAGAGLEWIKSENEILPYIFPDASSPGTADTSRANIGKVMDHETTLSVREIPVSIPMPDWNTWLPIYAPEDMWPTASDYNVPYNYYGNLKTAITSTSGAVTRASNGTLYSTVGQLHKDIGNWLGGGLNDHFGWRLSGKNYDLESPVSLRRNPWLHREEVPQNLAKWSAMKTLEIVRKYDLESIMDDEASAQANHPYYTPEALSIPSGTSLVFSHAPHIISDNWTNFDGQPSNLGKMESNQWYHLQMILQSGFRKQWSMNVPLDWAYQLAHTVDASERSNNYYGMQRLVTQIKMLQMRYTGKGIRQGGFSQRTLHPQFFFAASGAQRYLFEGALDAIESGLSDKVYEAYLYEWLDVIQSYDMTDTTTFPRGKTKNNHQFEESTFLPTEWIPGTSDYFSSDNVTRLYRLLPLLVDAGIDEMLVDDVIEWCKLMWPYDATSWGSTPYWDAITSPKSIYSENFEDQASGLSGLNFAAIKDAAYVNDYSVVPRNGGGKYVASKGLTGGGSGTTTRSTFENVSIPLGNADRLLLRARTAFRDNDGTSPGSVRVRMRVKFDGGSLQNGDITLTLDPDLFDKKFESYVSYIDVPSGATNLTQVTFQWLRDGGSGGGTAYLDNMHVIPVDDTPDTVAPQAPVLVRIYHNGGTILRSTWGNTNPASDGVVGYNLYRYDADGDVLATTIKLNTGLIRSPNLEYKDYQADQTTRYTYYLTAVDAAGNESAQSNSITKTRNQETTAPDSPSILFADVDQDLRLGWFNVMTWDVAGYDVYRKAEGEPAYTMLTTISEPAEPIFFDDDDPASHTNYEYYIEAFDIVGNASSASPTLPVYYAGELAVHYDASDTSSLTKSGNSVTAWSKAYTDGMGSDVTVSGMTQSSATVMDSGEQGIGWDQLNRNQIMSTSENNALFDFATGTATGGYTILAAFEVSDLSAENNIIAGGGGFQKPNIKIFVQNDGDIHVRLSDATIITNIIGSRVTAGQSFVVGLTYEASTGVVAYWDSLGNATTQTIAPNADFSPNFPMYIGGSSNTNHKTDGIFGEIQIYSEALDAVEFQTQRDSMTSKWTQ